jgi:hypothetical protein
MNDYNEIADENPGIGSILTIESIIFHQLTSPLLKNKGAVS